MWYYQGKEYTETPEEYQGFVYEILELDTGKRYIGKKFFWKPKILPIRRHARDVSEHAPNQIGEVTTDLQQK